MYIKTIYVYRIKANHVWNRVNQVCRIKTNWVQGKQNMGRYINWVLEIG